MSERVSKALSDIYIYILAPSRETNSGYNQSTYRNINLVETRISVSAGVGGAHWRGLALSSHVTNHL